MPDGVPRVSAIALDLRVLAAAAGLSLLTGLLFGIVPALQLSKPDLTHALKEGARGSAAPGVSGCAAHSSSPKWRWPWCCSSARRSSSAASSR